MPGERDTVKDIISESTAKKTSEEAAGDTVTCPLTPLARQMLRAEGATKKPCLFVLDGMEAGHLIPLDERPIVVGRGVYCDLVLRDESVSRRHARVSLVSQSRLRVEDLASTNGTFVAGERVTEATLKNGDKVLFGPYALLRFTLEDDLDRVYQQDIYASSTRDNLTGTYNRKYLNQRIASDLSYTRRHCAPFTLIKFDIDEFARMTKIHGPQTGNQILVTVSHAVSEVIRREDVLSRSGDDEFAIIAKGTDLKGGEVFGERVRRQVAARPVRALDESGEELCITASVGVVTVHQNALADSMEVISAVDRNLSLARQRGQNCVVASQIDPMQGKGG